MSLSLKNSVHKILPKLDELKIPFKYTQERRMRTLSTTIAIADPKTTTSTIQNKIQGNGQGNGQEDGQEDGQGNGQGNGIEEISPSNMEDAITRFFVGPDRGPILASASILCLILYRIALTNDSINNINIHNPSFPFQSIDILIGIISIVIWWIQEHFLHRHFLHSNFDWFGRGIHQAHHDKPYYHISIDPTPLLLGWLCTTHILLRMVLPLHLALTATIGYSMAGMWYEWTHYIVHTKVKPKSKFMKQIRDNHIRHHLVNEDYWLGFSLPLVDDVFGTNPTVQEVRERMRMEKNI